MKRLDQEGIHEQGFADGQDSLVVRSGPGPDRHPGNGHDKFEGLVLSGKAVLIGPFAVPRPLNVPELPSPDGHVQDEAGAAVMQLVRTAAFRSTIRSRPSR